MTFVPTHTHYTQTFLSNISVALSSAHSNQKQKRMAYQVIIGACKQCKMQVQTIFHMGLYFFSMKQYLKYISKEHTNSFYTSSVMKIIVYMKH